MEPNWTTGATYYAALYLSEVIDHSGSVVVDLNLNNSMTDPRATVAAYGIYDDGGTVRGKLALLNFGLGKYDRHYFDHDEDDESTGPQPSQTFHIPANITDKIQYRILTAPSVYSTAASSISWAGQSVTTNGILDGDQITETKDGCLLAGCTIEIPSPGAALVLLDEDGFFYTGNSTIAGFGYTSSAGPQKKRRMSVNALGLVALAWIYLLL